MFIDYVNVLFSSNSQLVVAGRTSFRREYCTIKDCLIETGAYGGSAGEVGISEVGTSEVGIGEVGHREVSPPEVGFVEVFSNKHRLIELFALWEGEDDFAVYVLDLDHLVLFFDAKIHIFSDSAKFIFQGVEK